MADSHPVFVRLPRVAAEQLEQAATRAGLTKREVITRLVADDDLRRGHHAFQASVNEVLTLQETAELLRTDEPSVIELLDVGDLPGRKVGGEWRIAREAVLRWLNDATDQRSGA